MFGGTTSNTSVFGAPPTLGGSSGIFGSKPQASPFGAAPAFGSTNKPLDGSGSVFKSTSFGGQTSSNLFGGSSTSQGSLFGESSGVFGSSSITSQSKATSGPFGTQNSTPSLFGGVSGGGFSSSGSTFGANIFGSSQQTQPQNASGASAGSMPNSEPINLFVGSLKSSGATQGNMFGGGLPGNNAPTLFGGNQNQTTNTDSIFGSSFGMNQQQNLQSSIFSGLSSGSTAGAGNTNTFGNASPFQTAGGPSNVFGSVVPTNEQTGGSSTQQTSTPDLMSSTPNTSTSWFTGGSSNTSQPGSIFGAQAMNNTALGSGSTQTSSLFGATPLAPPVMESGFGNAASVQNVFGVPQSTWETTSATTCSPSNSSTNQMYTPLHLLTPEDREEFQRDEFLRIPLVPPPKELCF